MLPVDRTEALMAKERGSRSFHASANRRPRRIEGIAPVQQKWIEAMPLMNAHGECRVQPHDVVVSAARCSADAAHEIFAPGQVERSAVAENQAQSDKGLRGNAVVVIVIGGAMGRSHRRIPRARQGRTLQHEEIRYRPLPGRAQRRRRARYTIVCGAM